VTILVTGEALIDFFPTQCGSKQVFMPIPGGSPCNVAVGLSRLGVPAAFLTRISRDQFGSTLKAHLQESHVDLSYMSIGNERTASPLIEPRPPRKLIPPRTAPAMAGAVLGGISLRGGRGSINGDAEPGLA